MKPEDKQLLLTDLCARLPYGVKIHYKTAGWEDKNNTLSPQVIDNFLIRRDVVIKPYLRPMSSMTEEEKKELKFMCDIGPETLTNDSWINGKFGLGVIYKNNASICVDAIDWLNAHHFDYRDLISRGLAIEVTENNNPYKD